MEWVEGPARIAGLAAAILTTIYLLLRIYVTWMELNPETGQRSWRIIVYGAILLLLSILIALAYEKIKLIVNYYEQGVSAGLVLHFAVYAVTARLMLKL